MGNGLSVKDTPTFIYPRPETIANPLGAAEVDEVLLHLARELEIDPEYELRPCGGNSIVIPDSGPDEVWTAIDRLLPIWKQARLFFLPRLNFPRCEC
jgi:hypothetical protein